MVLAVAPAEATSKLLVAPECSAPHVSVQFIQKKMGPGCLPENYAVDGFRPLPFRTPAASARPPADAHGPGPGPASPSATLR